MTERSPEIRHPYCLRCYAALPAFDGARCICERCGFLNVRHDLGVFWTKEKRMRDLEELAKTAIVIFLVGVALLVGLGLKRGSGIGMGQGWAVGFPILIAVVLWETAEKITRRKPYFRPAIVWRIVFLVLGGPILVIGVGSGRAGNPDGTVIAIVGALVVAAALAVGPAVRALARWRDHRILTRQTAVR